MKIVKDLKEFPLLQAMDATVTYILIISSIFITTPAFQAHCQTLNCSNEALDIHFPFRVSAHGPQKNCSHPSFELSCKNNTTMIEFPSYGELGVKSISYNERKLQLMDPKSCVHEVFLNLNLSFTPFKYYYVVKNYTYLNCSTRLGPSFLEIPCLSGSSRHHIYTVESSNLSSVPVSCRAQKTVAIPFSFSPYLSDNTFGLAFTWSLPQCEDYGCLEQNKDISMEGWNSGDICVRLLKILLCMLGVGMAVSIKIYHSKKLDREFGKQVLNYNKIQHN